MLANLIAAIITGAIIGSLILPGKQTLSVPKTIVIGIIAAVIVGLIFGAWAHWIVSTIVAAIVAAGLMLLGDKKGWLKI